MPDTTTRTAAASVRQEDSRDAFGRFLVEMAARWDGGPPPDGPDPQLTGEPAAAYGRYLLYRNLGPGRSVEAAYEASRPAAKRRKRRTARQAPGSWLEEFFRWRWFERAVAWDVRRLPAMAAETLLSVAALEAAMQQKTTEFYARGSRTPKGHPR